MTFDKEDIERLKKLKVENFLDLALITPSKYENLFISNIPKIGIPNVVDAKILSSSFHPKYLKFQLFAKNLNMQLNAIVFHPRAFHRAKFVSGNELYLFAKLEKSYNSLQLVQPQIIDEINQITPKYKTSLQNRTIIALMQKYLTLESLTKEGLDEAMAKALMHIHFPSIEFIDQFQREGFDKNIIGLLKYVEIYNHIKKLSTKKVTYPSKKVLDSNIDSFISSLPFNLTNDQKKVIGEIQNDLKKDIAAKRVIMGDVGCGKTMVILASAMISYPNRSILMAPTTILASQIFEEAKKFLPENVKITLVTNASKEEDLSEYDFIIGTHALLFRKLPDSPLVMIDEQHRFGTKQRNLIKKLVSQEEFQPHVLQFSATPIPRTLSMIQSHIIDISNIKELPFKKDIDTYILTPKDFSSLVDKIKDEIKHKRQVIIVYPLVQESESINYQSIDEAKEYWLKNFENVYVTHGKDKDKERVLEEFRDNGSILVATTLIEVGISLPNLSTIVIVAPERLGLASLHQLRGRVSRTGLKGYCYLFTKQNPTDRLIEFSKTLDGFEIAELDLAFRQGGDLLKGDLQSGKHFKFFDPKSDEKILQRAKKAL